MEFREFLRRSLEGLGRLAQLGTPQGQLRALALLAMLENDTSPRIAARLGVTPQSVNRWRRLAHRAAAQGWSPDEFLDRVNQPCGRPRTVERMRIQHESAPVKAGPRKGKPGHDVVEPGRNDYDNGFYTGIVEEMKARHDEDPDSRVLSRATVYRALGEGHIRSPTTPAK